VLDLEEKQGWRNRAVIGGLQAMSERWLEDARAEELDPDMLEATTALMAHYETVAPRSRAGVIEKIRMALSGEVDDYDDLLDGVIEQDELADDLETRLAEDEDDFEDEDADEDAEEYDEADGDESPKPSKPRGRGDHSSAPADTISPPEATNVARARVRKQKQSKQKQERINRSPHDLQASPTILTGVGEATAEQLARLGINRVVDLLWHLPARHEDYSALRTIDKLEPGEQVTIIANIWEVRTRKVGINREMVQAILGDGTGTLHATWWNKYIVKQLKPNSTMRFSGKVGLYMGQKTLDNPVFEDADADMVATGRLAPVYRLTEGLSHKKLRELMRQALDEFVYFMSDPLPRAICEKYELPDLSTALHQIHFPDDADSLTAAQKRLAFEEFFYIQLGVLQRRQELQETAAPALANDDALIEQFLTRLPFQMTGAQRRVLGEIARDLQRSVPMTRLVQGDVGSGKTAVAAGAMWIAAANGYQSALLAPTQILAEQHHRGIGQLLDGVQRPDGKPIRVALLTGRVTGPARDEILAGLADGNIDIVVGTTALIQEQVQFNSLAFAVVDEQHRFGVEQRGALRSKSEQQPHLLVMSATPIPRSLALTIYGDLDVSAIDEMPPGRMEVKTKRFRPRERERLYSFARREVQEGRQVFIIYPLVEESEKLNVGSAVEEHARLSSEIFPDLRLGLLHGRMSGAEKDEVMRAFADRDYDMLVSTSVIEVGIDVPNASLIIIEDAERFGLAQLHQFRGRVGRGQQQSYCALVSKADNPDAEERLQALADTNNGFALAEKDLELRGPGEFLGTRQSGLPELRIAHLSDVATLSMAREAAQALFADDPDLSKHNALQKQVWRFWRGHGDVN
jgi:ATP-dependent DNA helicase RecG